MFIPFKKSFFVLASAAILLSACGDKTAIDAERASINLIAQSNPEMILSLKAQEILDKSGMSDGAVFPGAFKMIFAEMIDYVTDSEKTGIDFSGKSFVLADINDEGTIESVVTVFNLKDPEAFAKLIREDMEVEPAEKNDYHYVISPKNEMAICWYKKFGMFIMTDPNNFDITKEQMEKLMDEKMAQSIVETEPNENYATFLKEDADFSAMIFSGDMMKLGNREARGKEKEQLANLIETFDGSYTYYTVSFETDKISAKMINHLSDKAKAKTKDLTKKGVDPSTLSFLTNDKLFGFFSLSLSPSNFMSFIESVDPEEISKEKNQFSEKTGIAFNDLVNSFTGDFAMSFVGMEEVEKSYEYQDEAGKTQTETYKSNEPLFSVSLGIKGDLLKSMVDTMPDLTKSENGVYKNRDAYMVFTPGKLYISNSESLANSVATNGKLKDFKADGLEKKASENPFFGMFDFKPLVASMSEREKEARQVMANWDKVYAYGNMEEMHFEMTFRNTGENGLYVITKAVMDTFFQFEF
ncbi:MAG: DUF4836 family protein [Flavobacteriales bacterium]|nr:DUF4836 family protein [Flavobacteriales bacterium]